MSLAHPAQRVAYRAFRNVKQFYIKNPRAPFVRTFFGAFELANGVLSPRRLDERKQHEAKMWKAAYFARFPEGSPYELISDAPLALGSDDHKWPRGTLHDNSTNRRFNLKTYNYFKNSPNLSLLDLGCAGGGLVKSFIEDGYNGVGIDGSDISRKLRSGEWDTIPYHLFTADITEPFQVSDRAKTAAKFHVVTAWEVLEHIPVAKVAPFLSNIAKHLTDDGIFVGSVAQFPDGNPLTGAVYHVNLNPRDWWLARFAEAGMVPVENHPYEVEDYVRGHGRGLKDWDPADGEGFHVVMRRK